MVKAKKRKKQTNRSSCSQMFLKISVLKYFAIFTGTPHPCLRVSFYRPSGLKTLLKIDSNTDVFCGYCKIFKSNFFSNKAKYIGPFNAWLYFSENFMEAADFRSNKLFLEISRSLPQLLYILISYFCYLQDWGYLKVISP